VASSRLDLGLEQTLVFVLCEPCALGESIPESLGESNFRVLNGNVEVAAAVVAVVVTAAPAANF
jgi:hypothetical protein